MIGMVVMMIIMVMAVFDKTILMWMMIAVMV